MIVSISDTLPYSFYKVVSLVIEQYTLYIFYGSQTTKSLNYLLNPYAKHSLYLSLDLDRLLFLDR